VSQEPSPATPFWFAPSAPRLRPILCRGGRLVRPAREASLAQHVHLNIPTSQSTQSSGYTLHSPAAILKLVVAIGLLATLENTKFRNMGVRLL
jgi:hypothetical protein